MNLMADIGVRSVGSTMTRFPAASAGQMAQAQRILIKDPVSITVSPNKFQPMTPPIIAWVVERADEIRRSDSRSLVGPPAHHGAKADRRNVKAAVAKPKIVHGNLCQPAF